MRFDFGDWTYRRWIVAVFFDSWSAIFRAIIAAVCAYTLLVVLLRSAGKRTLSKMNAFDFIVTIALGSTLATIVVSKDLSIATGAAALGTLVGMQYVVAWLSVRSETVRKISRSEPRLLVRYGQLLHEAMTAERVNREEILSALRKHGVGTLEDAAAVILETDGTITVLQGALPPDASALTGVKGTPGA
jgi:uncharacterized membrane protein YcaP (DUF421 family)